MVDLCFGIYIANINKNSIQEKLITNLSSFSFLIRSTVKKTIYKAAREIIDRTNENSTIDIETDFDTKYCVVGTRLDNSIALIFTREAKPHGHLIILSKCLLLNNSIDDIPNSIPIIFNMIETELKMKKIQDNAEGVKKNLYDTIDSLLKRGESIENLIDRTKELTGNADKFADEAVKLNKCCYLF